MKIYVSDPSESLEDVFRRMIASAQTNVQIYYPYKDMVFVAQKTTTIEDLQMALGDSDSRCRLNEEMARKFFTFWESFNKLNAFSLTLSHTHRRANREWLDLNSHLHTAYTNLDLGGRQGANFVIYLVSATKSTRAFY